MMPSSSRRALLCAVVTGTSVTVVGCLSTGSSAGSNTNTASAAESPREPETEGPSETASAATKTPNEIGALPARSCGTGYTPLDPAWVVEDPGPLGGFELSVGRGSLSVGDELVATVTNVTDEPKVSGNRQKYDIQYRDGGSWRTIFGLPDEHAVWTDVGIEHQPGEGFAWEFTFTRDGLSDAVDLQPRYHACDPLYPGDYRFVYWGITSEREASEDFETEYALGAPFTVRAD